MIQLGRVNLTVVWYQKERKENGCRQVDPLVWSVLGGFKRKERKSFHTVRYQVPIT